ncbi:MAG: aminodeoxychorismate/anthranilate synthase component II [Crocinitomicaceae bacterium]|nr:aminodeoxychorismate/anthranilate synthase component II [Crocinitomicaceae bacterium]
MKRILIIDNYDSFTFNLSHYFFNLKTDVTVVRNDELIKDVQVFDKIIISPGPGLPKDAGNIMDIIASVAGKIPVLGVCLGMQAIAEYLGGSLFNQSIVKHGVEEEINLTNHPLFDNLSDRINVGLYHSWAVSGNGDYRTIAASDSGTIMAIVNEEQKMYGVQFHPESVMTPNGAQILQNFLEL